MRSTDLLLRRTIKDVGSSCLLLIASACDCEQLRGRFSIIGHTMDSQLTLTSQFTILGRTIDSQSFIHTLNFQFSIIGHTKDSQSLIYA